VEERRCLINGRIHHSTPVRAEHPSPIGGKMRHLPR
jgi:hypothetical protein